MFGMDLFNIMYGRFGSDTQLTVTFSDHSFCFPYISVSDCRFLLGKLLHVKCTLNNDVDIYYFQSKREFLDKYGSLPPRYDASVEVLSDYDSFIPGRKLKQYQTR